MRVCAYTALLVQRVRRPSGKQRSGEVHTNIARLATAELVASRDFSSASDNGFGGRRHALTFGSGLVYAFAVVDARHRKSAS